MVAFVFLLVAATIYVALGWGTLVLFFNIFPSSGHPPAPHAPDWLYISTYLVAFPLLAVGCGIWLSRKLWQHLKRSTRNPV